MMYGPHGGFFFLGPLVFFGLLVLLVLFVLLAVALMRKRGGFDRAQLMAQRFANGPSATASAESILAERFARGEIDAEDYQTRRSVLRGERTQEPPPPPPPVGTEKTEPIPPTS
ncbi:SHOCT domain-containing protein [Fodinicola acaciae]|uniref:SHOCT domain-containing protein n=1 Tax=Fodinicola acaciae TaxID=2681555 RepID=UPI0013D1442D|nr:SHOCT domain-containing protein [Fodinicola acaciae]